MKRLLLLAALAAMAASAGCGKAIDHVLGIKEYSPQELRGIATDALAAVSSPDALANDCAVAVACQQSAASNHLVRVLQTTPEWAEMTELRPFAEKLPNFHVLVALPKVPDRDLPPHVWLRFGSHARYAWLLLFPSEPAPHPFLSTCENLSGTVYLSHTLP